MLSMEVPLWHPAVLLSQPHAHLSPLNLQMITKGTKIFHFSIQEVSQMIQIGKDLSFMNLASEDLSSYLAIFTLLLCYSALERSYPIGHQMLLLQPTKIKAKKTSIPLLFIFSDSPVLCIVSETVQKCSENFPCQREELKSFLSKPYRVLFPLLLKDHP